MKVRYKKSKTEGSSSRFNVHALSEVIVATDDGDYDSAFISDLDVFVNDQWKDMGQAFKDKDILPDNYNEYFAEPTTDEQRERGYL